MGRMTAEYHLIFFLEKNFICSSDALSYFKLLNSEHLWSHIHRVTYLLQNSDEGKTPYSLNIPTKLGEVSFLKINPDDSVLFLRLCILGGCRDVFLCFLNEILQFKILRVA